MNMRMTPSVLIIMITSESVSVSPSVSSCPTSQMTTLTGKQSSSRYSRVGPWVLSSALTFAVDEQNKVIIFHPRAVNFGPGKQVNIYPRDTIG